jgi:hypothetical protein
MEQWKRIYRQHVNKLAQHKTYEDQRKPCPNGPRS